MQLDAWRQITPPQDQAHARLQAVADEADDNAWRRTFRRAALAGDTKQLKMLAGQAEALTQPPSVLAWLGSVLDAAGLPEDATTILRQAQQRYPGDFWINYDLGHFLIFGPAPHPDEAVGYFRAAVAARPQSAEAHSILGLALHLKGDIDGAIAAFQHAIALDPEFAIARMNLGGSLRQKGQFEEAIAAYREAIRLEPGLHEARLFLANFLKDKGQRDEAITEYREVLRLQKDFEQRRAHRYRLPTQRKDHDRHQKQFAEARTNLINALKERADAYNQSGQVDKANADLSEALALDRWQRGESYGRLSLWELAAADFAKAFQLQAPSSPRLWFCHALLRVHVGDAEGYRKVATQFLQHFKQTRTVELGDWNVLPRALTLAPVPDIDLDWAAEQAKLAAKKEGGPWPWNNNSLGLVHYRAGKYEQALGPLREALRSDSHWRFAILSHSVLAMAYHRLGRAGEARQALSEADQKVEKWQQSLLRLSHGPAPDTWWDLLEGLVLYREAKILLNGSAPPEDARPIIARARAFAALGDRDKAEEACSRAVELGGKNVGVRLAGARIRAELHEYDKAIADLIEPAPKDVCAWENRGIAYAVLGQWHKAASDLAKVTELEKSNVSAWYLRAVLCLKLGNREGYRQVCESMLDSSGDALPETVRLVAWACSLGPDNGVDSDRLVELAEKLASQNPKNRSDQTIFGAALYRAGRFEDAERRLNQAAALPADPFQPAEYTWFFLAMVQQRLGHAKEAREWLEKTQKQMEQKAKDADEPWNRRLTLQLLSREAEALLGVKEKKEPETKGQEKQKKQ